MRKAAAILLALIPLTVQAWTPAADQRIAKKGADLAPPDLRLLLQRFESDYQRGLEMARADEGSAAHHYYVASRQGRLKERIEKETQATIFMIRKNESMSSVVMRLGVLAHLVADANNPFHIADDDPRLKSSKDDYEKYFERRMTKFATVFYGLERPFHLQKYLDQTFTRTAKFYPLLSEEFFRFGVRRSTTEFDDRSTAFGIAAVCYSRSVTDLVNLYYYIWKEAGGDVRSAPAMTRGNLLVNAN